MTARSKPIIYERPDLRWAEKLLDGESLQPMAPTPPSLGAHDLAMDARVIPWGTYCNHNDADLTDCPYYALTPYGGCTCSYLKVEACNYQNDYSRAAVAAHFGGEAAMRAAGVVDSFCLDDRIKICGINEDNAYFAEGPGDNTLAFAMAAYTAAVAANYVQATAEEMKQGQYSTAPGSPAWSRQVDCAYARVEVWTALCNLVEPVPQAAIQQLRHQDGRLRMNSLPSAEPLVDTSEPFWAWALARFAEPQKQFWYLYLKPLGS